MAPIHNAVRNGNLNGVRALNSGTNINERTHTGSTALMSATYHGQLAMVRELLDRGANINARDTTGTTALMRAADYGNLPLVKLLLDRGANINARNNSGSTALVYAALFGHLAMVRELLDRGAKINARNNNGQTALMRAAYYGRLVMVRLLLERGANTNGVLNRNNIRGNIINAIMKHKAGLTIAKYKKTSNMRRRAASAKALNNVRTPNGRPLPPNAIRSIMSMLKPRSPQKMRV